MGLMVLIAFGKIQRFIRDVNLALSHACGGIFYKARLYSQHWLGINSKPFNSGLFGDQKQRLLNVFMVICVPEDDIFRVKYGPRIASTAQPPRPFDSPEAKHKLFYALPSILSSWVKHLETPKLGRWFSWNG